MVSLWCKQFISVMYCKPRTSISCVMILTENILTSNSTLQNNDRIQVFITLKKIIEINHSFVSKKRIEFAFQVVNFHFICF